MSFFRGAFLTLFSNAGVTVLSLFTGIILARTLGPTGRGLMATVILWPVMLTWAGGLSLGWTNIYFGASQPQLRSRLFGNSLWAALVQGTIVGVVAACVLPRFVHLTHLQYALLMFSLFTLAVSLAGDFTFSLFYSTGDFARLGLVRIVQAATTAVLLLALWATHSLTVLTAVLATWIGGWLQFGITLYFLRRAGYVSFGWDFALFKQTFSYSARAHVGTLASVANGRIDQLIMTAVFAPRSLGLYAFAVTLAELFKQITNTISTVLFPKAAETDHESRRQLAILTTRWTLIISILCCAAMLAVLPVAVPLVWGTRYDSAIPAARILLPGSIFLALSSTMGTALSGAGRPGVMTVAETISAAIMIPLLFLWMPRYGIFGAGLASTVGYIVNTVVQAYYFSQTFGRQSLSQLRPTRSDWNDLGQALARMRRRSAPTPTAAEA